MRPCGIAEVDASRAAPTVKPSVNFMSDNLKYWLKDFDQIWPSFLYSSSYIALYRAIRVTRMKDTCRSLEVPSYKSKLTEQAADRLCEGIL